MPTLRRTAATAADLAYPAVGRRHVIRAARIVFAARMAQALVLVIWWRPHGEGAHQCP
jgi:hypothetical protein